MGDMKKEQDSALDILQQKISGLKTSIQQKQEEIEAYRKQYQVTSPQIQKYYCDHIFFSDRHPVCVTINSLLGRQIQARSRHSTHDRRSWKIKRRSFQVTP
jgi:hypothetical protein